MQTKTSHDYNVDDKKIVWSHILSYTDAKDVLTRCLCLNTFFYDLINGDSLLWRSFLASDFIDYDEDEGYERDDDDDDEESSDEESCREERPRKRRKVVENDAKAKWIAVSRKRSDISVSVNRLLDNNFPTIVHAMEMVREWIQKFSTIASFKISDELKQLLLYSGTVLTDIRILSFSEIESTYDNMMRVQASARQRCVTSSYWIPFALSKTTTDLFCINCDPTEEVYSQTSNGSIAYCYMKEDGYEDYLLTVRSLSEFLNLIENRNDDTEEEIAISQQSQSEFAFITNLQNDFIKYLTERSYFITPVCFQDSQIGSMSGSQQFF